MRIKSIALEWFRGAADRVTLEPDCKSLVVYGANGSGKSSFVDAVEYVLSNGRIRHLAHEYSGKHQEKGIPNTHKPEDRKATLNIKFKDDSELRTEIRDNGSFTRTGAEVVAMDTWDYRRTVLSRTRSPHSSTTPKETSTRPCCLCSAWTRWRSRPRTSASSRRRSRKSRGSAR